MIPPSDIKDSQWAYYRHWLILIVVTEALMLVFSGHLVEIYLAVAVVFAVGFLLRVFKLYPGQWEPLSLDLSAAVLALAFVLAARWLGASPWRFLLILCSSLIVFPHFVFIAREK